MPRRRMWLLRHEYRRHQHARLHQGDRRRARAGENLSAAASTCREGPGARPEKLLRAICVDRTLVADIDAHARKGVAAVAPGPRQARWYVRVHPLRLLLDVLPQLLVEFGPLSRSGRTAAGEPLGSG